MVAIGVAFPHVVVASEIGSYKPAHRHWEVFREQTHVGEGSHVHVAQSLYHDVEPATALGIPCIWVNRLGEPDDPRPTKTLPDLAGLPDALDELVSG
jgi:2-haloacid dehalogenase